MGHLLLGGVLVGVTAALFWWRNHGWRYAILPAGWVAVVFPVLASVHSYAVQLVGFVLMAAGAWSLDGRRPRLNIAARHAAEPDSSSAELKAVGQGDQAEAGASTLPEQDGPWTRGETDILRLLEDESLTSDQQYKYLSEMLAVTDRAAHSRTDMDRSVRAPLSTVVLERTLRSDSVKVRRVSIDLLERLDGEREAELIASALESDTGLTVWKAAAALLKIGRRDRAAVRRLLPELVRCLDGESGNLEPKDRYTVVRAISSARAPEMVAVLARCAVEPDVLVRKAAADGLFVIGTPDAYEALQAAVEQLSLLKGRHARRALLGLKHNVPPSD